MTPKRNRLDIADRYIAELTGQAGAKRVTPPISAADLMAMDFPEPEMVIEGVLPVGVTLLVGKPKKGKSWMGLGMCEAVAAGGKAFGIKDVSRGEALYLALEDNPRRIKKRLAKVLDGRDAPKGMYVKTDWPRIDEGGADRLDEYFEANPDTRIAVIDTLAKVRKPVRGANVYAEDYAALEPLLPLAQKHNVAIVVVYHLRKAAAADPMDEISSSTGLTAGVDGFLILRRVPGSKGPTLFVDGRDIEEPTEYALHWNLNTASWTIEGNAEEVHLSKERADILLTINRARRYMTPKEVTEALGPHAKYNNVKYLMWAMLGDGQLLKNDKGGYYPANPTNPINPTSSANLTNPTPNSVSGIVDGTEATNPTFLRKNGKYDASVSGISKVSGDGEIPLEDFAPTLPRQNSPQVNEGQNGLEGVPGSDNLSSPDGGSAPGFAQGDHDVVVEVGHAGSNGGRHKVGRRLTEAETFAYRHLRSEGLDAETARARILAGDLGGGAKGTGGAPGPP